MRLVYFNQFLRADTHDPKIAVVEPRTRKAIYANEVRIKRGVLRSGKLRGVDHEVIAWIEAEEVEILS